MIETNLTALIGVAGVVLYGVAVYCALYAIERSRTPQAALAWSIALLSFPVLTVPLYLVFGRNKFHGYVQAHRSSAARASPQDSGVLEEIASYAAPPPEPLVSLFRTVQKLTTFPFTRGNGAEILIDADQGYRSMLRAIEAAQTYVLIQSYIVRADASGLRFRDALVERAAAGVTVYFLYDEIGCVRLPASYLRSLSRAGVRVSGFKTTKRLGARWQINFRNHRKVLVVDGHCAFLGGLNIGDEYVGGHPRLGHWRDTHLRITGPAVQMTQLGFVEDWYWAERALPIVEWRPEGEVEGGLAMSVVRTGPADENPVCELLHVEIFNTARRRLWLAFGYFVPDPPIIRALQLAALRGVDVRVLLPARSDSRLAWLASFNYLPAMLSAGVRVLHYTDGTMHQKVILVDDHLASVGSCNLDNRSLHINFEVTALVADQHFAKQVETMLLADFASATAFDQADFDEKPYWFKIAVKAVDLAAPVL